MNQEEKRASREHNYWMMRMYGLKRVSVTFVCIPTDDCIYHSALLSTYVLTYEVTTITPLFALHRIVRRRWYLGKNYLPTYSLPFLKASPCYPSYLPTAAHLPCNPFLLPPCLLMGSQLPPPFLNQRQKAFPFPFSSTSTSTSASTSTNHSK